MEIILVLRYYINKFTPFINLIA